MAIVRFDPFRDLAVLQDRMNRLFNDSVGGRHRDDDLMSRGAWTPAVDIYEQDGGLVLKAEVPDITREDIDITVENNTLTIRAEDVRPYLAPAEGRPFETAFLRGRRVEELLALLEREQLLEQPRREAEPERRRVERREDARQRAELGVERVDPFRAADRLLTELSASRVSL